MRILYYAIAITVTITFAITITISIIIIIIIFFMILIIIRPGLQGRPGEGAVARPQPGLRCQSDNLM